MSLFSEAELRLLKISDKIAEPRMDRRIQRLGLEEMRRRWREQKQRNRDQAKNKSAVKPKDDAGKG